MIFFACTLRWEKLNISSFADGGKVHLRTGLKLCAGKRQAGRETLTIRHLPLALTPHAITKSPDQQIRNPGIATTRWTTILVLLDRYSKIDHKDIYSDSVYARFLTSVLHIRKNRSKNALLSGKHMSRTKQRKSLSAPPAAHYGYSTGTGTNLDLHAQHRIS
jgi:hypothetical protein